MRVTKYYSGLLNSEYFCIFNPILLVFQDGAQPESIAPTPSACYDYDLSQELLEEVDSQLIGVIPYAPLRELSPTHTIAFWINNC